MIEDLKEKIVGIELGLVDLDNYMIEEGFCSIFEQRIEDIIDDKNVVYQAISDDDTDVILYFEVLDDSDLENFVLKVREVNEF